jgi:hypothetical protein
LELRRLEPAQPCNCLGNAFDVTRGEALRRNAVLLAVGLALFAPLLAGALETGAISQATIGASLLLVGFLAALSYSSRIVQAADVAHARGAGADNARRGGRFAA